MTLAGQLVVAHHVILFKIIAYAEALLSPYSAIFIALAYGYETHQHLDAN